MRPTADRLQRLARRWKTSQAEVVRRAIQLTAEHVETEDASAVERLRDYRARAPIDRATADAYIESIRVDRATWARE